ncbi:hypothetical protein RMSM_03920 [Rhodopirellula maiorica SM1]|uniref:Uncharacterized protein n=1 Tax=Rhodopirellula maiorica SM1 TaxID=1265738 RepID=M5RIK5_9BACT|nr:dual specificity protein phosphatase family protein [Rhodopirellula maiorica]EMI19148.1 hypothetical protein RMSM_03920 [Rhodopirellula maiorica SM1]
MSYRLLNVFAIVTAVIAVSDCGYCSRLAAEDVVLSSERDSIVSDHKLESHDLGNTPNVLRFGNVILAGQPDRELFSEFKQRGITTVLTLREPVELEWDEKQVAEAAGLRFFQLPVQGPDDLSTEMFDQSLQIIRSAKDDEKVLVHCAAASRVGAVWMAHRILDGKLSVDEARQEARQVGLRAPVLEAKVLEYVQAKRGDQSSELPK